MEQHQQEMQERIQNFKGFIPLLQSQIKNLNEINVRLENENMQFIDTVFPPIDLSVFGQEKQDKKIEWKRATEIIPENQIKLIENNAIPNDIVQGQLGDCWLMCSISSLAEFPTQEHSYDLVSRLFATKDYNKNGIYILRICKNGEWQNVIVDDYFPCRPKQGPIFARNFGNEIWVLLLEKAYAKLHGSYYALKGGFCYEAMMDLTGFPTTILYIPQPDEQNYEQEKNKIFNKILQFDQRGFMLSAGMAGQDRWSDKAENNKTAGLVPGHAYSLLRVVNFENQRLVQLRNPWSKVE